MVGGRDSVSRNWSGLPESPAQTQSSSLGGIVMCRTLFGRGPDQRRIGRALVGSQSRCAGSRPPRRTGRGDRCCDDRAMGNSFFQTKSGPIECVRKGVKTLRTPTKAGQRLFSVANQSKRIQSAANGMRRQSGQGRSVRLAAVTGDVSNARGLVLTRILPSPWVCAWASAFARRMSLGSVSLLANRLGALAVRKTSSLKRSESPDVYLVRPSLSSMQSTNSHLAP